MAKNRQHRWVRLREQVQRQRQRLQRYPLPLPTKRIQEIPLVKIHSVARRWNLTFLLDDCSLSSSAVLFVVAFVLAAGFACSWPGVDCDEILVERLGTGSSPSALVLRGIVTSGIASECKYQT